MRLVMTLVLRDDADVVDAQIAFHLNAGVDLVIARADASQAGTTEILESYQREGYLRLIRESSELREAEWRTRLARLAATDYGADWVINSNHAEFWWPRGESLKEVLAPIPPRYTIVQGLRRLFLPQQNADFFAEGMTFRRSIADAVTPADASLPTLLRPLHRADSNVAVNADGTVALGRNVPLRAWYPIEVFSFPVRSSEEGMGERPPDASLVTDTRLRDALRTLRDTTTGEGAAGRAFALPTAEASRLSFRTPNIVEDASYAVECAAVGEVDLPRLEQYMTELEQRVAWLEARFWPRVLGKLSRLVGRQAV